MKRTVQQAAVALLFSMLFTSITNAAQESQMHANSQQMPTATVQEMKANFESDQNAGKFQGTPDEESRSGRDTSLPTGSSSFNMTMPEIAAAAGLLILAVRNGRRHPQVFHIGK